jgi:DNA modification methylase
MAPEIAMKYLDLLTPGSIVCDPMSGSGTVSALATRKGLHPIAFDLDPLAALMTLVRCSKAKHIDEVPALWGKMQKCISADASHDLPWIDGCDETSSYIKYWFGARQVKPLRRAAYFLAYAPAALQKPEAANIIRLALSRIVIRKTSGASLAWDVSHSRPHRVYEAKTYDFDVQQALDASVRKTHLMLAEDPAITSCRVRIGDAKKLSGVRLGKVDAIVTSPPYLNAIDYLRGHRLSLVWLGLTIPQIRKIRGSSVGSEASQYRQISASNIAVTAEYPISALPQRQVSMITRYSDDLVQLAERAFKILRPGGTATYVVGDNFLSGVHLSNSSALKKALELSGFEISDTTVRDIPARHRYLPVKVLAENSLSKRMAQEIVIHARRPIHANT